MCICVSCAGLAMWCIRVEVACGDDGLSLELQHMFAGVAGNDWWCLCWCACVPVCLANGSAMWTPSE
eukprot:7412231-Alexandrium_andersonii.AAC.1